MLRAIPWDTMMRLVMLLGLGYLGLAPMLGAATVLLSHSGSSNPTTEGWAVNTSSPSNSVTGAAYDDGTPSWRITDPGNASGGTNLYYLSTMTAAKVSEILTSGFEYTATIRIPSPDDVDPPVAAWGVNSNAWLGFLVANDGLNNRRAWALMFGRNTAGQTIVTTYQNAPPASPQRILDSGYHDFSLVYDPLTRLTTVTVDGDIWLTDYAGYNAGAASGTNQIYWGDNSAQSTVQAPRETDFAAVRFTQLDAPAAVPEPGRTLLLVTGLGAWAVGRRRRKDRTKADPSQEVKQDARDG